jgi:hypothetical protein
MDVAKTLAGGLAANRALFGATYLIKPEQARTSWIGRAAKKPAAQVMIRSQGARDVALGAGALQAVVRDQELRPWMLAHAVADVADLVATWLARDDLPKRRTRAVLVIAGASAAVAAGAAATARG